MAKMKQRIMSLAMALVMALSLLPTAALAEGELSGTVTFDISQGSVTANADGVTGWPKDAEEAVTLTWDEVANCDIVVTGKSDNGENVITVAEKCKHDLELTLDNVTILSHDAAEGTAADPRVQAAISIQTAEARTLTLTLKGENHLHATAGRLLWTQNGSMMKFVGQDTDGDRATLELSDTDTPISLLYGGETGSGMFEFENCAVTMAGRDLDSGKQVLSNGTKVYLGEKATITDGTDQVFGSGIVREVVHDIGAGDVTIGREYMAACGVGYLIYRDAADLTHVVTGTSTSGRVTVTYPGAMVVLKNLSITTTTRSAFLVRYADAADSGETLTVQVAGKVSLQTSTASTFNTNEAEKGASLAPVTVEGVTEDAQLTITRTADGDATVNAAVGVDLTVKNLACSISRNCMGDVTADAGSEVFVAGDIGGDAEEKEDGRLIRGTFGYRFVVDGREFKAVADQSNDGMLTLLLPSSADLSAVTMEVTNGWTVASDALTEDGKLDFENAEANTISMRMTPLPEVADKFDVTEQTVRVKAMQGSEDIPAVYLHLTKGSMAEVNGDKDHETKAKGNATILGANDLNEAAMEIKGRGNASWNSPKKSYQIKLDQKANVLGMGRSKKWILLPSYEDNSRVRSAVGFMLAKELGTEFASEWEYVDLYVDGEYYGLYILCEKVEIGKNRIDIDNIDDALEGAIGKDKYLSNENETNVDYSDDHGIATLTDGTKIDLTDGTKIDLTGGYHLEFDNNPDPLQFGAGVDQKNGGVNIKMITVKEPEYLGEHPETDESFTYIRNFMDAADAAVYGNDEEELRKYVDLESFAQMWLLRDYMLDWDATDNLHIWKESDYTGDGLIHAGPAWDFDNSLGRATGNPGDQRIKEEHADKESEEKSAGDWNAKWLAQLLRHPAFQEELVRQYNLHKELFTCCDGCTCDWTGRSSQAVLGDCTENCGCYIHNFAAKQADRIADSVAMDMIRWTSKTDFVNDVHRVQAFACERNDYLADRLAGFGVTLYTVTFMNGKETVDIQAGSTGLQTLPEAKKSGYKLEGWFYQDAEDNEVEFIPGTQVTEDMTVTAKWTVDTEDLTVKADKTSVEKTYNGQAAKLTVTAKHSAEGVSYAYQWYQGDPADMESAVALEGATNASYPVTNVADSGAYFCVVTATVGSEPFSKTSEKITAAIRPKTLDEGAVADIADRTYTGSAITPTLTVKDGEKPLTAGTDYTVTSYENNVKTGTATVTVTFQGNYEGTVVKTFNIVKRSSTHSRDDDDDRITIKNPETPMASLPALNKEDHTAYIKGYADGTVRPSNYITRAQVATIFYRLLTEESLDAFYKDTNSFTDIPQSYWANEAISTLSSAGIIGGYADGTFRPDAFITRAQFAAIAARFSVVTEDLPNPFSDVPEGYWAEDLIAYAAEVGWVNGYADGTFRPTANITRAAAMKLINNVLERQVDEDGLLENATQWSDCTPDDWCYYIVMEATNSHDWERRNSKSLVEDWTALTADPVWDE